MSRYIIDDIAMLECPSEITEWIKNNSFLDGDEFLGSIIRVFTGWWKPYQADIYAADCKRIMESIAQLLKEEESKAQILLKKQKKDKRLCQECGRELEKHEDETCIHCAWASKKGGR